MNKLTQHVSSLLNKDWKINLLLFICSFSIYFTYLNHIFLNANSVLSSSTLDSIKNYYTFIYHIKNDDSLLHFSGLNYPFGEHIVYTDGQPLFTFIFRLLPFTHQHLIGIAHGLILLSFIVTPLIINKLFLRTGTDKFSSFFVALAIALLSPQLWRLDGHFALCYNYFIPLTALFLVKFLQEKKNTTLLFMFVHNTLLFLIHPYLGFGASLFCLITLLIFYLLNFDGRSVFKQLTQSLFVGALPVLLFKLFMILTDLHKNRTVEPHGIDILVASISSVFVASFGPFQNLLKNLITSASPDYEGFAYIGLFSNILIVGCVLVIPFSLRKLSFKKEVFSLFLSSLTLLLFSFGLHTQLFETLGIQLSALNQFRALGRFAWFFYYMLPLFLISILYPIFKGWMLEKHPLLNFRILAVLFFACNLFEANFIFKNHSQTFFKDRNIFNKKLLNAEEIKIIKSIHDKNPQAIVTLPAYFLGSEVYSRFGGSMEMIPSMLYSYHARQPIVGTFLSRTSITETEDGVELFNSYKKNRKLMSLINNQLFFVIRTKEPILPDEDRFFKKVKLFYQNDSLSFGYINKRDILKLSISKNTFSVYENMLNNADSSNVIYIRFENRKPFLPSSIKDYEKPFELDSNQLKSGKYVVSFRYYFTKKTHRGVSCDLIVTKINKKENVWWKLAPIRTLSGFYNGFALFEYPFEFEKENKYEFIIKGSLNETYRISDFIIRPFNKDVLTRTKRGDTLSVNSFPYIR